VLDPQRAEIRTHLESLLKIVNNSGEFKEGINRLDDEGLKKYQKMLRALFFELTYEKRADYYFGDILESPVFQKVNVSGNSEITKNTTATVNNQGTRTWIDINNYIAWINQYYDLSNRRRFLHARIDVLRKNARRNRVEIAEKEGEIQGIDFFLPSIIHRINTHFTRDNFGNRQFITIENTQQQNENNKSGEQSRNIIWETISDWGPVISMTAYATGLFKIGLVVDGITIAADFTPAINDFIQTGNLTKFTQTIAARSASFLIRRGASDVAVRNLTRGLREDEIARKIRMALETLIGTSTDRLIETMNWGNYER